THVEVQPEGCRASRRGVEERGAALWVGGTGVAFEARPDARERQEIGEVQGVEQRAPDVLIPVPRERAEPGLERIRLLDAGAEPVVLELLEDLARRGLQDRTVALEQEQRAR